MLILDYLPELGILALLDTVVILVVIPWVLLTKRDSTVAVAWCLVVLLMPLLGALLFWAVGYNYMQARMRKKRSHRVRFPQAHPPARREATRGAGESDAEQAAHNELARLALAFHAFPLSAGNKVTLYHETAHAFAGLLEAIRAARHHVHLEYFILRSDSTGERLLDLLTEKAKSGVEVRLLYDSMGGLFLRRKFLRPLVDAGGHVCSFLPVNPLRSWVQINLRNHRKITVVDGAVGFTGGMNVGDEYLGKTQKFGYWRDNFLKVEGPAVAGLQRIFIEDWDFADKVALNEPPYFPEVPARGEDTVQVVESGPDQGLVNTIREVYFAAILAARERLWIASPYFVPDSGILDALRLARRRGVDVRLLCPMRPDHFLSFYAGRYYWADLLALGVPVYQYARGMMHCKLILVDRRWAISGSANLDNRSLKLNFEVACILHTPRLVEELEARYEQDLADSVRLDPDAFARRSLLLRVTENACRLFSPVL